MRKYENGINRITSDRLTLCAKILGVPVGHLCGEGEESETPRYNKAALTVAAEIIALPNDDIRKSIYHLARTINKNWPEQNNQNSKNEKEQVA